MGIGVLRIEYLTELDWLVLHPNYDPCMKNQQSLRIDINTLVIEWI